MILEAEWGSRKAVFGSIRGISVVVTRVIKNQANRYQLEGRKFSSPLFFVLLTA